MPADPRRVKDLFAAALDLPDPADRAALLERECGEDAGLRRRLDVLLAAHDRPDPALDQPLAGGTIDDPADVAGTVIAGRHKLLEEIGEGGMGTVWMAEQREPVRRLVALKLIKPGMDSRAVLARFEAERQALALMDHPNIAKVLDGGTTDQGRPFFVMELVKGLPLTAYCDDRRLPVRDRLDLFVQVCQAVQHAHQKGIIHRDLKPSNVLVTEHDGTPVPKVIDFGLAKALHGPQALTEKTLHTSFGAVVGTPLYMAPEQVGINALDVDTRTDIYALGVILYELLTGTTPLEKKRVAAAAWDEMRRLIREEEPPRPSLRLSSSDALPSLAATRQTEPAKLSKLVRGELDWIVMKALEKDRNRRYETATGFAADVRRHLAGDPVQAVPPSAGYRLRKFVRRHRTGVFVVGLVAASVAAIVFNELIAWAEITRERDRAVAAEREARAERDAAERERDRARQAEARAEAENQAAVAVLGFFQNEVLAAARPQERRGGLGLDATVRAALAAAEPAVATNFRGWPTVEASVRAVLGQTYFDREEYDEAARQFGLAAEKGAAGWSPDDDFTLQLTGRQGEALLGAGKADQAVPLLEHAVSKLRAKSGPDGASALPFLSDLADAYVATGRFADAVGPLRELLAHERGRSPGDDAVLARTLAHLGRCLAESHRPEEAEPVLRECLALRQKAHPDSWLTFNAKSLLGGALLGVHKYAEAEPLLRDGYEGMKARAATIPPRSRPARLTEAADRLVRLSEVAGQSAEAAKWRAERAELVWALADAPAAVK